MRFFSKQFQLRFFSKIKSLMLRVGPTEEHKLAWLDFEKVKMYFCNLGMLTNFIQDVAFMAMGRSHYQSSKLYMEEEGNANYNTELAETIFPYCKWILISMTFGRILLMAISYKYLCITKVYFLYQAVFFAIWNSLPNDYGIAQERMVLGWSYLFFLAYTIKYWNCALAWCGVSVYVILVVRPFMYGAEIKYLGALFSIGFQLYVFTIIHLFISLTGFMYTEAEILRKGNEQLLNNLKEGVVIVEEKSGLVTFVNEAAGHFGVRLNKGLRISLGKDDTKSSAQVKQFARFDMGLFK